MPKPKPLAGVDTLLLLLTHHWARDESVYRTEDDRLDFATITLFLAYTGARPAEFVHASKGTAGQDPLGEEDKLRSRDTQLLEHRSDYEDDSEILDDILDEDLFGKEEQHVYSDDNQDFVNDSDESSFDSDGNDETSSELIPDEQFDDHNIPDSGYSSDKVRKMPQSGLQNGLIEIDGVSDPIPQVVDAPLAESGEQVRKWKALCYEDVCLWVVRNPKAGERDLLVMEVFLRHHKGADKKPKPYVCLLY